MYRLNNGDIKTITYFKRWNTCAYYRKEFFSNRHKVIYDDDINRNLTNAIHQKITDTKFKGYKPISTLYLPI
jgi:hypothetical protein